jgi:hypothetical protein
MNTNLHNPPLQIHVQVFDFDGKKRQKRQIDSQKI